jgi:transposase
MVPLSQRLPGWIPEVDDDEGCDPVESSSGDAEVEVVEVGSNGQSASDLTQSHSTTTSFLSCPIGKLREAPTIPDVMRAKEDLLNLLHPKRNSGSGYKIYSKNELDPYVRAHLDLMHAFFNFYTNPKSLTFGSWKGSALQAAIGVDRGENCARFLKSIARDFIRDHTVLPGNPYGEWTESILADEDIRNDIQIFLQSCGKEITAEKLHLYFASQEFQAQHDIPKVPSVRTCRDYIHALDYRFEHQRKGCYADGHERPDVVEERDKRFIPSIMDLMERCQLYDRDGNPFQGPQAWPNGLRVIIWWHDESIFYAHDRCRKYWQHKDSSATPYAKGEGTSFMVADYVSADFGWLKSVDGTRSARRTMYPGINKDGYFQSADILEQAEAAIDILESDYPGYEHVFVYDNAPSHLARAPEAPSARHIPKFPREWSATASEKNTNGRLVRDDNSKVKTTKIRMADPIDNDGTWPLYFDTDHPSHPGQFKGMKVLLQERNAPPSVLKLNAECKNFNCPNGGKSDCCMRRVLFRHPHFASPPSLLFETCKTRGISVLFLPKFHPELNFIEQCWGYAKCVYRLKPFSKETAVLERNTLESLESVPLVCMRRCVFIFVLQSLSHYISSFATRSIRFMDAYKHGLNGVQAAWAARKYRGHRIPDTILNVIEKNGIH